MKFSIIGICCHERSVERLALLIFSGGAEEFGQIALRFFIAGSKFQPRLQFGDRIIRLPGSSQYSAQLQVYAGIIGPLSGEIAQSALSFRKVFRAHVDVGESGHRLYRLRIKSSNLLVLFFRAGQIVLTFQQQPRRDVRLGIFRLHRRRLPVSFQSFLRFACFEHMRQRQPGALPAFFHMVCRGEFRGGTQVLRGIRLACISCARRSSTWARPGKG